MTKRPSHQSEIATGLPAAPTEAERDEARKAFARPEGANKVCVRRSQVPKAVMEAMQEASANAQDAGRDLDKVIIRLPDGMRDALKVAAAVSNRSMNAEIVARLKDTMEWPNLVATTEASLGRIGDALRSAESMFNDAAEIAERYKTEAEAANLKVEVLRARLQRLRGEEA